MELKRIGSNVNQIAQKVNAGAFTSYNFQEVVDQLGALHQELCALPGAAHGNGDIHPGEKQSLGAMKGVMDYVRQEKKTRDPVTGQRFVTGVHCLGTMPTGNSWPPNAPTARRRA